MASKIDNYGPCPDPLNVDWSAWKIPGWDQEAVNLLCRRRTATSRMRRFRVVQVKRRIWFVTLTATSIDPDELGRCERSATLTATPQAFWTLSRRRARALVKADQAAGGSGTMYPVEYRHCPVCGRLLLGPEAHDYRMKQLRPMRDWHFEDGPACSMDCKPHGRGENGQHLTYHRKGKAA